MKQLNINITKASLQSYTVELKEGKPVINATIQLMTEGGMQVTTYSVYTDGWNEQNKFELPLEAIKPIIELARILEDAVVVKCRDSQLALTSGVEADPITEEDLTALVLPAEIPDSDDYANPKTRDKDAVMLDEIDNKPIDLSEIPF